MSERILQLIRDELATLTIRKKIGATSALIQCPFHDDKTPSCGINLNIEKPVPLGWFSCFSCKERGDWNKLAQTLGLRQTKKRSKLTDADFLEPSRFKKVLLGDDEQNEDTERIEKDLKLLDFFDFPPEMEKWRGFKVDFLMKLGARYAYHDATESFLVWFPCMVNGQQTGYLKASLEKKEGVPSYINSPGSWTRTSGLLFFDYAIQMMKEQNHKTVVLVEGPRDGLRCIRYGIPAMPILGTKSWSDEKRLLLEQAGVENVIIFMDGDLPDKNGHIAGKEATKLLVRSLKGFLNYQYMNLWKYEKNWDPGNCPRRFLDKVKSGLHSFGEST